MKEIKCFYKDVKTEIDDGIYQIKLDGRSVKTPAKAELATKSRALAEAIAEEWRSQEETVRPQEMPLTTLACTAIDRAGAERERIVDDTAAYAEHDLLCYWADDQPQLRVRQEQLWQPLLDWAAEAFDARLTVGGGVIPVRQSPEALSNLRAAVADFDDFGLIAVSAATEAAGSLVIGLALTKGRLDAEGAFAAAQLDESYQSELWGEDREAKLRRRSIKNDLEAAARFLAFLGQS